MTEMEKPFKPHPNMVRLFDYYLLIALTPVVVVGIAVTSLVYVIDAGYSYVPAVSVFVPVALIAVFILYWNRRYYDSFSFNLTRDEVVVEHGVWWKMKHTVPYGRVMSVDIVQGPLSRRLGIGTVDVYTAGYTGVAGGTGGPGKRRAEASIVHVSNFAELRENILSTVRGRPLFAASRSGADTEMLVELRKMRELMEKSSRKQ